MKIVSLLFMLSLRIHSQLKSEYIFLDLLMFRRSFLKPENPSNNIFNSVNHWVFILYNLALWRSLEIQVLDTKYSINKTKDKNIPSIEKISSKRYWGQLRDSAAECKCFAPLCLNTYSIQYVARLRGVSCWSLKISDKYWAFLEYL